ncbi:MAG: NitT/TauT family transport system permease protein [Cellvibrionaceae bacterium]|jgi:NitT/TauT family transport system permease protein
MNFFIIRKPLPQNARWLISSGFMVLIVFSWWLPTHMQWVNPLFLPSPERVVLRLVEWWQSGMLTTDLGISIYRVTAAFLIATAMAIPLGVLIGTLQPIQSALQPLFEFSRYLPAVAFVPLILLWVGIDESAKITIIWIGTFFQMVLMVSEDVRRVPQYQLDAALSLGAKQSELFSLVVFKSALPDIVNTLRLTLGWAWTYLVVAELVAANTGVGHAILKAQRFFQTETIFAGILMIGLIGLAMDQALRAVHRFAFPWLYMRRD